MRTPIQRLCQAFALERNILVIASTVLLLIMSIYTWYQLLPLYFRDLGADDTQVGLAYSLMNLGYALLQWTGGLLADRYGRKRLIVLPTFCFVPLYVLAGMTTRWEILLAIMLAINSLSALQWPSFMALIAESVPQAQRGTAFGVFEFCVGLGVTLGPALGATLLRAVGLRELICATGGTALVCAIGRTIALQETAAEPSRSRAADVGRVLHGQLRWLLVAASIFYTGMAFTVHGPFVSLHAKDVLHLPDAQINWLFAAGSLVATGVSLAGGRLTDRVGGRLMLIAASAGHFATLVAWASVSGLQIGLPIFALSWALMQVSFIAYSTTLTQSVPAPSRAAIVGLFGTVTGVISTAAPAIGALMREEWGSAAPFWVALGLGLLMTLITARAYPPEDASAAPPAATNSAT